MQMTTVKLSLRSAKNKLNANDDCETITLNNKKKLFFCYRDVFA